MSRRFSDPLPQPLVTAQRLLRYVDTFLYEQQPFVGHYLVYVVTPTVLLSQLRLSLRVSSRPCPPLGRIAEQVYQYGSTVVLASMVRAIKLSYMGDSQL
jgi:hypothetical protein